MNKLMLTFVAFDLTFLLCGGLILGFALVGQQQEQDTATVETVGYTVLLMECPLRAAVFNAVMIFITFLVSLPALALPLNKSLLKMQALGVICCAIYTLALGLFVWFDTLQTRSNLNRLWYSLPSTTQSLLQQRFQCCGYDNGGGSPSATAMATGVNTFSFIPDTVCTNAFTASQLQGCVTPFSAFANQYLDLVFTAAFGIVGFDFLLLLVIIMVVKYRAELDRYRHIDEKNSTRF